MSLFYKSDAFGWAEDWVNLYLSFIIFPCFYIKNVYNYKSFFHNFIFYYGANSYDLLLTTFSGRATPQLKYKTYRLIELGNNKD